MQRSLLQPKMQNGRFAVPPPSLDRAMVPYDLPTGKYLNAGTLQGAQYLSCSWSMTASSSSLASSVDISPMSAPLRSSDTELHSSGKKNQKKSWRLWKLFSRYRNLMIRSFYFSRISHIYTGKIRRTIHTLKILLKA